MKVYFISGLGGDERVFKNIKLPADCQAIHLPWIEPLPNESLKDYAIRLAANIDVNERFALVGLSLGGMIATEISHHLSAEKVILISSIPLSAQMPTQYKLAAALRVHKFIPISFIKNLSKIKRLFSFENADDKKMLMTMASDTDPKFIRWAITAALSWRNNNLPQNLYHLHGTSDQVLPMRLTKPGYVISKGGHLMVLNRAKEINKLMEEILLEDSAS